MFKDDSFIKNSYQTLTSEREFILKELSSFKDLTVYPSKGNFILSEIKSKK
ncbi:putative threonine-phosphate decarboxylase domain protein [[Clostridium] sordellii ATCC 9714]|nr:putative threonine-phosphate decarboxylase domain protein [[Clostridium] sordellii ATCC 9714] [Paeniclostridium sordellii ATCC 9714]